MADPRDDDRVSGAYRELPGDGPSPAIDAAIQAAARRAVGSRPGAVRRWQIPVSIAAVLALAVGISLQVDREKPLVVDGTPVSSGSAEYPVPQAAPDKEEPVAPAKQAAVPAPQSVAPAAPATQSVAPAAPAPQSVAPAAPATQSVAPAAPAPAPLAKEASSRPAPAPMPAPEKKRFAPEPPAPAAAPASPPAPALPAAAGAVAPAEAMRAAPQPAARAKSELSRDATTQEKVMSQALETPERRLERIADLRAKGLHDEADRALSEFRRSYPDYRLSEEWLRKVERR